jgi:hypothetical protein
MGRRKIVDNDESVPAMTTYVPRKLKVAEQGICKMYGVSLSNRVRFLLERDVAEHSGVNVKPDFDFEDKKSERIKLKKTEDVLCKMLECENLANRKNAYDTMVALAVSLGTDGTLTKNIDDVLVQLNQYEVGDRDPFNDSTRETFVEYLETVLKRRAIEAELKAHRRQGHEPLD